VTAPAYEQPVTVLPWATVVLARNPGPMTLEGTNTWLLGEGERLVVVDPGEDDETHLQAVLAAVADRGARVGEVVLTHGHHDHSGGARRFHDLTGAPVRALDPAHRFGGEGLTAGEVVDLDGRPLRVALTPGHTADSVCLLTDDAVLTGDTVLGRGTTVVAWPDGDLASYLASLHTLADLGDRTVLPGHGPVLPAVAPVARAYLAHREQRLEQVRAVLAAPDVDPAGDVDALVETVVERVYADVDRAVWPAARLSVRAQLDYLRGR
jgi:glyoxylase-like metal-dependent hydrolase (beta-lactamase superfamily II)